MINFQVITIYKINYILKKPFPDNSFCLNDCRCGGKFDLVLFISCLILGLCLLERNLDFIIVVGNYNIKFHISLSDNRKVIL